MYYHRVMFIGTPREAWIENKRRPRARIKAIDMGYTLIYNIDLMEYGRTANKMKEYICRRYKTKGSNLFSINISFSLGSNL